VAFGADATTENCTQRVVIFLQELDRTLAAAPRSVRTVQMVADQLRNVQNCDIDEVFAKSRQSKFFSEIYDWGAGYTVIFKSNSFKVSFGLRKDMKNIELPAAMVRCGDKACP
jgi:hypothetical protein